MFILEYDVCHLLLCQKDRTDKTTDNHKPDLSSSSPATSLTPSVSDPSSYNLSIKDKSDRYSYTGARTTGDGQYVLVFDAVKEHYVLHKIDSTFDMNLTNTPWTNDTSALQSQYPQIDIETTQASPQRKAPKPKAATAAKTDVPKKKIIVPKKAKAAVRDPSPEEEEESDDGFTVEDPSANTSHHASQPTFQRQASEDVSDEDEDAEHELYEEDEHNQDVDHLRLPSPANNDAGLSDEDLEADLEKEFEAEFEEALKEGDGAGSESSESEEE